MEMQMFPLISKEEQTLRIAEIHIEKKLNA